MRSFQPCAVLGIVLCVLGVLFAPATAPAEVAPRADRPWMSTTASAEQRTRILLEAMTQDEKLALVFGYFSSDAPWKNFKRPEGGLEQSAGYVAGTVRLGIPALTETDAGTGVASQPGDHPRSKTALPSNLADVTLSVDPRLLAQYDSTQKTWITAKGEYELVLSSDARTPVAKTVVRLAPSTVGQVRSVHRMLQP